MRIQCEVCSATYTIDDAQLTDQPVGAQCPYCGHVKLVTRAGPADGAGAASAEEPVPQSGGGGWDQGLDFAQEPPSPAPAPGGGFSAYGAQGGPPAEFADLAPQSGQEFGSAPAGGPEMSGAQDFGGAPALGGAQDFGDALEGNQALGGGARPMGEYSSADGGLELPDADEADVGGAACSVCGTPLVDEFDKVIGLCEVHQQKQQGGQALAGDVQWWVRPRHGGRAEGPMSLDDVRDRLRRGELTSHDDVSRDGSNFSPVERFPELAYISALKSPQISNERASGVTVHRGASPGQVFKWLVLGGVVAAVGAGAWSQRTVIQRVYENLLAGRVSSKPIGLNPVRRVAAAWQEELGAPELGLEELLAEGDESLNRDTWSDYGQAEEFFRRALLVDQDEARAIGGYVEAFAARSLATSSPERVKFVEAVIRYGLRLHPESMAVHRGAAALAVARNRLNQCLDHGNAAVRHGPEDGRARLLLAQCFLEGNVELAIEEIEGAKASNPELLLVPRLLGAAHARLGRFETAMGFHEARQQLTPEDGASYIDVGDLERSLGRSTQAQQAYEQALQKSGYDQKAHIRLGELMLELRRPVQAAEAFQSALRLAPPQGPRGSAIFGGWARAELLAGRPGRAAELAEQALTFDREYLPALIVRGESALLLKDRDTAERMASRAQKEGPNEPAVLVLAGRAAEQRNDFKKALDNLQNARANDPRDPRLAGILAAYHLRRGQPTQAYVVMAEAADIDPEEARARSRFTPVALSDVPVAEAIEAFRASASTERNAPVAYAAIGLMLYFSGEPGQAQEAVDRALRLDDGVIPGLIYAAQLQLDGERPRRTLRTSGRILALERGHPLALVLRARAQMALGQTQRAEDSFDDALRANPGFTEAAVARAGLQLDGPNRDEALAELERAFAINPNSLRLRRLLREAGL